MRIELDMPPAPWKPKERHYLILKSWDALRTCLSQSGLKRTRRTVRTISPGREYRVTITGVDMNAWNTAFGLSRRPR